MNKGTYVWFHIKSFRQSQQVNLLAGKESLVCKKVWA